ncbi:MAG: hypothetical protein KGM47_04375, partial [Acidobacteriota bacterium]|nr:hypothetical protein [Acidobacteriota bacterium]
NIDLAALAGGSGGQSPCGCGPSGAGAVQSFLVGAKGHAVFHVSGGPGGFALHVGRSAQEPQPREFDSIELKDGDLFTATFLRPGVYSVKNLASKQKTEVNLEIDVAYPHAGKTPYQPPAAVRVECVREGFRPAKLKLQALQGCIFVCQVPSRIKTELVRPHDPPDSAR